MLNPPNITPSTTENDLAHDIVLTFVSTPAWEDAITGITINGNECETNSYKIESGLITIQWRNFEFAMTTEISIEATGYNTAFVSQTITTAKWADLIFFEITDSTVYPISHDDISDWDKYYTNSTYKTTIHTVVKKFISSEIKKFWYRWEMGIKDRLSLPAFNCLDNIKNPRILKDLLIFQSLVRLTDYQIQDNSEIYYLKRKEFNVLYNQEFQKVLPLLDFDEPVTEYESREYKALRIVR